MKIALLDVMRAHASRLSKVLSWPHEFVAATAHRQTVDVVIGLRFGPDQARHFEMSLLQMSGAGADQVDFAALPPGCVVCNVFEHEIPIAEYVMAAVLDHAIGYSAMHREFDASAWSAIYAARKTHAEISGATLGLVGYGHVGRAVTQRAKAFGMHVHVVSASGRAPEADRAADASGLHAMLPQVDYLVLACPLNDTTRGLIGVTELALLKPTCVLINIARAAIVDEQALYDALVSARLGGATLDVWYRYPNAENPAAQPSRFRFDRLPQVHCTAHVSAWTEQLFDRRCAAIAENLSRFRQGQPLRNVIYPV